MKSSDTVAYMDPQKTREKTIPSWASQAVSDIAGRSETVILA